MREMVPFEQFDFGGVPDKYSSCKNFGSDEGGNITKQTHMSGTEYWGESGDANSFCSDLGWYQDNTAEEGILLSECQQGQQLPSFTDFGSLDDLYFDIVSPPFESCQDGITKVVGIQSENLEVTEPEKEKHHLFPSASLKILKNVGSRFSLLNGEKIYGPSYDTACTKATGQKLSTDAILRLGGEKFIQSCSQCVDDLSMLSQPLASSFLGLTDEETKDVELVQCLLASADKVGQQQFDSASKLVNQCDDLSS